MSHTSLLIATYVERKPLQDEFGTVEDAYSIRILQILISALYGPNVRAIFTKRK